MERIIQASSSEGDTVLDPFMGTGTTALAAEKHGRDWLGIELNPEYARIAEERLAAERRKHRARADRPGTRRESQTGGRRDRHVHTAQPRSQRRIR